MNTSVKTPATTAEISLAQQRILLRQQMASQRLIIESQLGPVRTENTRLYPRSKTMRFLMQRPELMKKLLGLVVGASFIKSMHPVLTIAKFLYSNAKPRW